MSFLDLAQHDQGIAAGPQPNEQARLPATFGQGFEASWNENQLFGQSLSGETARQQALSDHIDDVRARTGVDLAKDIDYSGAAFGGALTADMLRETVNATARKAGQPELSADDLDQAAIAKSRAARTDYALMAAREKAPGGGVGFLLGGLAGAASDPINVLALPVAPAEGLPLLAYALRWGAIAGASQAGIEAVGAPFREAVQPGYLESGEPLANVAGGAAMGAVGGVALRGLAHAWTRVKTGAWPTSVRDAGNLAESEANVQATNVYPGAAGEAAHRDALATALDQVVKGEPVSVSHIITPELEAQSRRIMTRLEGEQHMALPIFDERAIRLTSEEAGLRARAGELDRHVAGLPQGDLSAADRLNRLDAIDQQIATAAPAERKALQQRRDQILVDTTPEALRAAAAPIAARQAAQTEQANIAARLNEIAAERARFEAETTPPMIGQRQPARLVPFEQVRAATAELTEQAVAERAAAGAGPTPELPFAATTKEGQAAQATDALKSSIAQIADKGGHTLAPEEIAAIAARLAKMSPEEATGAARDIQISPHQMAAAPARARTATAPEPRVELSSEATAKMLESPEHEAAMRADVERATAMKDVKVPDGVDKNGEPIWRSADAAMNEIDGFKAAADTIKACANPQPETPENG